jgi:hypothetical protein
MSQPSGASLRSETLAELYAERQQIRASFVGFRAQVSRMGATLARIGEIAIDSVEPDAAHARDIATLEAEVSSIEEAIALLDQQLGIARRELTDLDARLASEAAARWQRRIARGVLSLILLALLVASAARIFLAEAT